MAVSMQPNSVTVDVFSGKAVIGLAPYDSDEQRFISMIGAVKKVSVPLSELDQSIVDALMVFAVAKQNYTEENPDAQPTQAQLIEAALIKAKATGLKLIKEFSEENIALGITQLGLTKSVLEATLMVLLAMQSGSLYAAIEYIAAIDPAKLDANILTPARALAFRNKIEAAVGVPLATAWDQAKTW